MLSSSTELLGKLEAGKAGIIPFENKWDAKKQKGIIRVGNKHVDALRASLALIKQIGNREVIVRSLGVSGMLNKAESKFMN